jgi:nitroreductase
LHLPIDALEMLIGRRSVREYTDEVPSDTIIDLLLRYAVYAPTVAQLYSVIVCKEGPHAYGAPLSLVLCIDKYRLSRIMSSLGFVINTSDLSMLMLGAQDVACVATYISLAAHILGLGSCIIGKCNLFSDRIEILREKHNLPVGVLPIMEIVIGYAKRRTERTPRIPKFVVFNGIHKSLDTSSAENIIQFMDNAYFDIGYYDKLQKYGSEEMPRKALVKYTWSEHLKNKWSRECDRQDQLRLTFKEMGYDIGQVES